MVLTAANRASGPLQPGLFDRSIVGGAELHGVVWTYLGSFGAVEPEQLWSMVKPLCANLLNKIGYEDCIHGVGHTIFNDAVIYTGGYAKTGVGPCQFFPSYSLDIFPEIIERAITTMKAAPYLGWTIEVSRGMWMACAEVFNITSTALTQSTLSKIPTGALEWSYFLFAADPLAPNITLGCPYQPDFAVGCFYWQFQNRRFLPTFTIQSVVGDCMAYDMIDEGARYACLVGGLGAWALDPGTYPTEAESLEYLQTCLTLEGQLQEACIAGVAWGAGMSQRDSNMITVSMGEALPAKTPNMCELMKTMNMSADAVSLCASTYVGCTVPGWCDGHEDFMSAAAKVAYA